MKTANLLMSVAIASVMIANPVTLTSADAAKIKIKVDVSNGHNAKVKPRIRIKPKITAAKAATKVKIKRKKKTSKKINPAPKPVEEAQIASVGGGKKNSKLTTGPSRGQSRYVELPEITDVLPTFRIDFEAGQDAAEAARAAAELKDLVGLGVLRDAATPDFGLATPDLARDIPSNAERLGEAGFERRTGGMFPGDDLGSGPGGFGTLANSHNRKTPNNPWGVNPQNAIDGIASTGTTTTVDVQGDFKIVKTANDTQDIATVEVVHSDGAGTMRGTYEYVDGAIQSADVNSYDTNGNHTHFYDNYGSGWSFAQRNGQDLPPTRLEPGERERFRRPDQSGVNRMTDPDYVGGGSNCNNVSCIVNGEGGLKPLDGSKLTVARVLPAGPDEDNGGISASGTPMYTANDVLERYDEDNRRRDQFQPANPDDFCFHSEC